MSKAWLVTLMALVACDQLVPKAPPPPVVRIERCIIMSEGEGANLTKAQALAFVEWPPRGAKSYYVRIGLLDDELMELRIDPRDKDRIFTAWIECAGTKK